MENTDTYTAMSTAAKTFARGDAGVTIANTLLGITNEHT